MQKRSQNWSGELTALKGLPDVPTRKNLREFHLERVSLSGRILNISQISDVLQILIQGRGYHYYIETSATDKDEIFSQVGRNIHTEGLFWFPFEATTVDTAYDMPRMFLSNLDNIRITGRPRLRIDYIRGETVEIIANGRAYLQEANKPTLTELRVFFRGDFFYEGQLVECWGHSGAKVGNQNFFTVSAVRILNPNHASEESNTLPSKPYLSGDSSQHLQRITVVGGPGRRFAC